jgi:hypothetical protein
MSIIGQTVSSGLRAGIMGNPQPILGVTRKSSPIVATFSPDDIDDLSWWIDPDDDSTITRVGLTDEIQFINDKKVGASTTRLQAHTTPVAYDGLFTATAHGRQWMEGNGTNRMLQVTFKAEPAVNFGAGELTIFMVAKRNFTSTATRFCLMQKGSLQAGAIRNYIDGAATAQIVSATGTVNNQDRFISRQMRDNTAEEFTAFVNGVSTGSAVSTSTVGDIDDTLFELMIGAAPLGSNTQWWWNNLIGEILFYKRALNATEITLIENYLTAKWLA